MRCILDQLKANQNRGSTTRNYYSVWKHLNAFLTKLDDVPDDWEDRVALFCTFLIEYCKIQSTTLRSYIPTIKNVLKTDGYKWSDERVWFHALIRSCKLQNDTITNRFPVHIGLLKILLFEMQ